MGMYKFYQVDALTQFAFHPSILVSMAEFIPDDIYEIIFLTLDLRDLIRCKSVCKSWKSFISGSRFVKAHLNRSYNRNENGHKRIGEAVFRTICGRRYIRHTLIGNSNGLVCIDDCYDGSNDYKLLVGNPSTREGRMVPKSPLTANYLISCWGFGYDSLTDDYKVVQGAQIGTGNTYFQVFSLKSNAWNIIGEVNYTGSEYQCGVFCNGAFHWVMHPKTNKQKQVILSFDLSKEEFKEITQPDYSGYKFSIFLGIFEECLCVCCFVPCSESKTWVMKKHNDTQSWELLPGNCRIKFEGKNIYNAEDEVRYWFIGNQKFHGVPTIMESLVSPHLKAENA